MKKRSFLMEPKEELERFLEAYKAGHVFALREAFIFAEETLTPIPLWIIEGVKKELGTRLSQSMPLGKGATGNEHAKAKANYKHFLRWQEVRKAKASGNSWEDSYYAAHEALEGTSAKGEEDTMKKSYQLVQASLNDPETSYQFFLPSFKSAVLLGLKKPPPGVG